MSKDMDISCTFWSLGTQIPQRMLCMCRITRQSLGNLNHISSSLPERLTVFKYLLVDNDIYLNTSLSASFQDLIQSPLLIFIRGSSQKQLWRQPPIGNINSLLCAIKSNGDSPHVIWRIDIPFNLVPIVLRSKGFESVRLGNGSAFTVYLLFVGFVMAMIWVEEILKLSNLVFEMWSFGFGVVQFRV